MTMRLLFWILMLLWIVTVYMGYGGSGIHMSGNLLLVVVIGLLGWKVFGLPVEG